MSNIKPGRWDRKPSPYCQHSASGPGGWGCPGLPIPLGTCSCAGHPRAAGSDRRPVISLRLRKEPAHLRCAVCGCLASEESRDEELCFGAWSWRQLGVSACSTMRHPLPDPPVFAPGPASSPSCCAESAGSVVTGQPGSTTFTVIPIPTLRSTASWSSGVHAANLAREVMGITMCFVRLRGRPGAVKQAARLVSAALQVRNACVHGRRAVAVGALAAATDDPHVFAHDNSARAMPCAIHRR